MNVAAVIAIVQEVVPHAREHQSKVFKWAQTKASIEVATTPFADGGEARVDLNRCSADWCEFAVIAASNTARLSVLGEQG